MCMYVAMCRYSRTHSITKNESTLKGMCHKLKCNIRNESVGGCMCKPRNHYATANFVVLLHLDHPPCATFK